MIGKLLCTIGIHKWVISRCRVESGDKHSSDLGIFLVDKQRSCTRKGCDCVEEEDVHCLGLNPPEYVHSWHRVDTVNKD